MTFYALVDDLCPYLEDVTDVARFGYSQVRTIETFSTPEFLLCWFNKTLKIMHSVDVPDARRLGTDFADSKLYIKFISGLVQQGLLAPPIGHDAIESATDNTRRAQYVVDVR